MSNTINNSYAVFKESLLILRKDKTMLLFPVLAGAAYLIAILSFILPLFLAIDLLGLFSLLPIFIFYLAIYCISIFFSSAIVVYASLRLRDNKPTVLGAMKISGKNLPNVLLWALFSATIGIILELIDKIIGERFDVLTSLLGAVWSLATFFVIPIMVFENKTPLDAMKESAALFKKRWGETITGTVGIGLSIFLLGLAGLLFFVGTMKILPDATLFFLPLFIIYLVFLAIVYNALNSIYVASLYHFATTGEVRGGYSEETIRNAGLSGRIRRDSH